MCGIAGATASDDQIAVAPMLHQLVHRGPDGTDVWAAPDDGVTLGCARLATTDPSESANQPLVTTDGRFVLAFNGYIAGHRRQIAKARQNGLAVTTDSDAELVLHLLACVVRRGGHVAKVLGDLSGQYALAFWDDEESCLWLARDPLGIKPLYVMSRPNGHIAFASEMAVLSEVQTLKRDDAIKADYLTHLFVPAPQTGVEGVTLMTPGKVLCWQGGKITCDQIRHPAKVRQDGQEQKASANVLLQAVRQSVADAMDADCAVGCLVSGGVDSAGVFALACDLARERGDQLPAAFVMGFDDPAIDETDAAQKLCDHFGQKLHVVPAPRTPAEIHDELCHSLRSVGAPFANPSIVLMRRLAKAVSAHVRVCLSGDGGDELFGGYPRYRAGQLFENYWRYVPAPLRQCLAEWVPHTSHRGIKRFLSGGCGEADHAFAYWNNRCAISELTNKLSLTAYGSDDSIGLQGSMMAFDRDVILPGNQLLMSDRCGMAFGVEYRLPLLAHEVVREATLISPHAHLKNGAKTIWRKAIAPYLPPGHAHNRKIGFNPPVADWVSGVANYLWGDEDRILDVVFTDIPASRNVKAGYWRRAVSGHDLDMALTVWALMVWQVWLGLDKECDDGVFSGNGRSSVRGTADIA